ncbi:MAG: Glu/Leu/Phe/Val dehydrogenase [Chlorobi bacterium]|nr:MAG: Glu/Leu/Phe/Val dehydrogenase [Bacteroidota bacterium]KXK34515.1 MAG: glutamate dehydrogenase [Chlorobi bacterium OLB6]MBL1160811.1 Glu/Leu/Phe/Val dehydrogenase [Chlorobiota bacterium]MBZ0195574.1 leucine dehydrogenase [Candidatus Kapabacteria bacterium]MCL4276463.1 Glu/Leu/Phe/Val dehydrogenase [Ignavibacteria bacterium]
MKLFDTLQTMGHEQVVLCSDPVTGLRAVIAIHDTSLGPALGGTRMWNYSTDEDAITDALRLSRGMTYKAAVSGVNLGGGKAVIIGDPRTDKNEAKFRSYGKMVESLRGRYITAEDVGTSVRDMEWIRMETRFVTGVGGVGGSGDPSPVTAFGVYSGMKAAAKFAWGTDSLSKKRVVVQGAGHVASNLVKHLVKDGAIVFVSDIYEERSNKVAAETGATVISPDEVFTTPCDIFSPNALGAVLNNETIAQLSCSVVCGAANNQLQNEDVHAAALQKQNIIYAPDYVVNSGGLMNVASEVTGYDRDSVMRQAEGIYDITMNILTTARDKNILTIEASNAIAEERIKKVRHVHGMFTGTPSIRGL